MGAHLDRYRRLKLTALTALLAALVGPARGASATILDDAHTLAQRDAPPWPALDRRPIGRLRDLMVPNASDVLDDGSRRWRPTCRCGRRNASASP
jgi:hypothetical protein